MSRGDVPDAGPVVVVERVGAVAVFTLNRPHVRNAVDAAMSAAAGSALRDAEADPGVHAVVVTGSGEAFCAGADIREFAAGRDVLAPEHPEWGFCGITGQLPAKPLLAAVNGAALGGGAEIVLAADLAIADERAVIGLPEVRIGLFAAAGGVLRVARQVPLKIALELALTGAPMPAGEASGWGIVNEVAPAGTALERTIALATTIAANAPLAVLASRSLVRRAAAADGDAGLWSANDEAIADLSGTADAREGARAFVERRPPRWQGR